MKRDFWGFKDPKELERITQDMPDSILREQIELLAEKTNYVLYGKPNFIKVRSEYIEYKIATVFDVVVPGLDNYSKTLLIMYSNPESEYPVSISIGSSYEEDCDIFCPKYTCRESNEFEIAIKEILSSDDIMRIIQVLYSKAFLLSK